MKTSFLIELLRFKWMFFSSLRYTILYHMYNTCDRKHAFASKQQRLFGAVFFVLVLVSVVRWECQIGCKIVIVGCIYWINHVHMLYCSRCFVFQKKKRQRNTNYSTDFIFPIYRFLFSTFPFRSPLNSEFWGFLWVIPLDYSTNNIHSTWICQNFS